MPVDVPSLEDANQEERIRPTLELSKVLLWSSAKHPVWPINRLIMFQDYFYQLVVGATSPERLVAGRGELERTETQSSCR